MTDLPENLISHPSSVTRQLREEHKSQRSFILWFTGLPCAGKSTLANAVESALHQQKLHTYLLDGDNVRHGLNRDLGFSMQERTENLRRIGEVGKLFLDAGIVTLAAFISPLRKDREMLRAMFAPGEFLEIYCSASLEVCERRDPKGMYRQARDEVIPEFTGISSPYETPQDPELEVNTGELSISESVKKVLLLLEFN